jgi:hypothetical protein
MIMDSFGRYVVETIHDHESALPKGSRVGVVGLEGHGVGGMRVREARRRGGPAGGREAGVRG